MAFALEPMVAGELGPGTQLDRSTHPPGVANFEYLLDAPRADDLIESFPVYLVSEPLAERLLAAKLSGFELATARVGPCDQYLEVYGDAPHNRYLWLRVGADRSADCWIGDDLRLCVSDRMMQVLATFDLRLCEIEPLSP